MPDEIPDPPWHDSVDWLSFHEGKVASLICARCGLHKRYRVSSILEAAGNIAVKSLPQATARALGCPHVDNPKGWNECKMRLDDMRVPPQPPQKDASVRRPPGVMVLEDIALYQMPEWYILYAVCGCGHYRLIDKDALARRYPGATRMKDLARKLSCRSCGNREGIIWGAKIADR